MSDAIENQDRLEPARRRLQLLLRQQAQRNDVLNRLKAALLCQQECATAFLSGTPNTIGSYEAAQQNTRAIEFEVQVHAPALPLDPTVFTAGRWIAAVMPVVGPDQGDATHKVLRRNALLKGFR